MINFDLNNIKLYIKPGKNKWKDILKTMTLNNCEKGYISIVDNKIMFFKDDPKINGITSCYITLNTVKEYCK